METERDDYVQPVAEGEAGQPGDGAGRREETGHGSIFPADVPPSEGATVRTPGSIGHREPGDEGDAGGSEL